MSQEFGAQVQVLEHLGNYALHDTHPTTFPQNIAATLEIPGQNLFRDALQ